MQDMDQKWVKENKFQKEILRLISAIISDLEAIIENNMIPKDVSHDLKEINFHVNQLYKFLINRDFWDLTNHNYKNSYQKTKDYLDFYRNYGWIW